MRQGTFRPCIDIHDGMVKQIVGGTLEKNTVTENFTSEYDAAYYANLYKMYNLPGGHIIILNKAGTDGYKAGLMQAEAALAAYPGGLQIGGGINDTNARQFLDMGASHVIVTSFIFSDGAINRENLNKILDVVSPQELVLDLSVRKANGDYYITTDRWQKISSVKLTDAMRELSQYAAEFLIHAADVEGKRQGADRELMRIIGTYVRLSDFTITYAGGIKDLEDAEYLAQRGVDYTIGSALDIFGGRIPFTEIVKMNAKLN